MPENTELMEAKQTGLGQAAMAGAGLSVWSDKGAFDQMLRVANMLSKSSIVPQAFQNKPEDCFIAVEMANRMNTNPIFIMQNLYVVKGKPSWAGQACMAMIMSCGKFKNVKHVYTGTANSENRGCYVTATRISDCEVINGTEVTLKMAQAEGWMSNSKWKNMPEQMLGYRAASFFARMYCPEALMGLQTAEEVYDVSGSESDEGVRIICEECGATIAGTKHFTPEQIAADSEAKFGKALCAKCQRKQKAASDNTIVTEPVKQTEPETPKEEAVLCEDCGNAIRPFENLSVVQLADYTRQSYGKQLCADCAKKAKAAKEKEEAN